MTADEYAELAELPSAAEHDAGRMLSAARLWQGRGTAIETEAMAEARAEVARRLSACAAAYEGYAHVVRAELRKVRTR